jgi:1,4-alpha-glucan branching enzyme
MIKGYVSFVLHSHLPWVLGHGRWPHGTDWLSEATAECYIPLLNQIIELIEQGYNPHLIIGVTPILQEQLTSTNFISEFDYYLNNTIKAAENDLKEFSRRGQKDLLTVAKMWKTHYEKLYEDFNKKFKSNLIESLKSLQEQGYIEVITSAATHGYLPLLKYDRSVNAQINLGVQVYRENFGRPPDGFWLPECAYRPAYKWKPPVGPDMKPYNRKGIDEFLSEHNIQYFITDGHLLKGGKAIGVYLTRFKALKNLWKNFEKEFVEIKEDFKKIPHEVYLVSSNPKIKPVAIFTRDPKTGLQVWSGEWGYPGESRYLDFHKKKFPGGLRYWRVTSPKIDLALKETYNPNEVEGKIIEHAKHFVGIIKEVASQYYETHKKSAFICAPFDTELFGHWWFEGPRWLYYVLKLIEEEKNLELATGDIILDKSMPDKVVSLPEGSWGEGGFHYIWLNEWTEWTWKRVYEAEDEFYSLYDKFSKSKDDQINNILKQLARELLLLQSSDWQFLISTWSARDYAELRFTRHFDNFKQLSRILIDYVKNKTLNHNDSNFLNDLTGQNNCFKSLDLTIYE